MNFHLKASAMQSIAEAFLLCIIGNSDGIPHNAKNALRAYDASSADRKSLRLPRLRGESCGAGFFIALMKMIIEIFQKKNEQILFDASIY